MQPDSAGAHYNAGNRLANSETRKARPRKAAPDGKFRKTETGDQAALFASKTQDPPPQRGDIEGAPFAIRAAINSSPK